MYYVNFVNVLYVSYFVRLTVKKRYEKALSGVRRHFNDQFSSFEPFSSAYSVCFQNAFSLTICLQIFIQKLYIYIYIQISLASRCIPKYIIQQGRQGNSMEFSIQFNFQNCVLSEETQHCTSTLPKRRNENKLFPKWKSYLQKSC